MSQYTSQCEQSSREILSRLPPALGLRLHLVAEEMYELRSDKCIIRLAFERYESEKLSVDIIDPTHVPKIGSGMALWILQHIRGARTSRSYSSDSFKEMGQMLTDHFSDVLTGDFSIRCVYDQYAPRILDSILAVLSLPRTSATRVKYDKFDLQWLFDLDRPK